MPSLAEGAVPGMFPPDPVLLLRSFGCRFARLRGDDPRGWKANLKRRRDATSMRRRTDGRLLGPHSGCIYVGDHWKTSSPRPNGLMARPGTESSNPSPSSGESANFWFLSGGSESHRSCQGLSDVCPRTHRHRQVTNRPQILQYDVHRASSRRFRLPIVRCPPSH
jgi:hypothetical protein